MRRDKGIFSEARFKVLKTLFIDGGEVSLREIAYRSGVSVHGVQVATHALLGAGLVKNKKVGQRVFFSINHSHYEYPAIGAVINALAIAGIKKHAVEDSEKNVNTLTAVENLRSFSLKLQAAHHGITNTI